MVDERALLRRAQAYDEKALAELYDEYAPLIYSYIYRRVQDAHLAEDLTSDVFLKTLEAIYAEQEWHTSFRAWIYRVAHNLVVDHYRKRPSTPVLSLEEQLVADLDVSESMETEGVALNQLQFAISQLTPEQQQVLVLRFGEQLKTKEVAEIMEKTVGSIEALQHRALDALRRLLKDVV
ncbi:MAG: sigma-70 family RNA polymerase sigma factor [Anaerolineae bacterium]|nr:sigma-70 family RNA polymerase sigma factor [Anaerolineae bacterium]